MNRLLLHVCCGPCATATVAELRQKYALVGYFYNPNIHPFSEYRRRLINAERFFLQAGISLIIPEYQPESYFIKIGTNFRAPERCRLCYQLRLEKTAQEAAAKNIKNISTTLLISPYQDHQQLQEIGFQTASEWGLNFHYQDLRPLFGRSRNLAKELGLYRQKYCGCLFSEKERLQTTSL